jgi:hypothetical protein
VKNLCLILLFTAATGLARVGEPVAKIKERFGKPEPKPPKNMVVWLIETNNGPLIYTVTYNAKGISIAEGLKPLKTAVLTARSANDFIQDQVALIKDPATTRIMKPGEKFEFAGQPFTCGENEFVLMNNANDLLVIWSRGTDGTVLAVCREMLQRPGR